MPDFVYVSLYSYNNVKYSFPMYWILNKIENVFNTTLNEFLLSYNYDDADNLYYLAIEEGISDVIKL